MLPSSPGCRGRFWTFVFKSDTPILSVFPENFESTPGEGMHGILRDLAPLAATSAVEGLQIYDFLEYLWQAEGLA